MKPRILTLAAGVPPEIAELFVQRFVTVSPVVSWLPLPISSTYTRVYSTQLYSRLVKKLKQTEGRDRHLLLRNVRLVLLYVDKGDGSELHLFSQFGSEALVVPFGIRETWQYSLNMTNRRNRAINQLVQGGRAALQHADILLSIITKELGDHDNTTCLLLPPRNFGRETSTIKDCVHEASAKRETGDEFKRKLRAISNSIRSTRIRERRYFVGNGGVVYRSPPKARSRHGIAPVWDDADHDPMCVIRGRIRFGSSFDPTFHYDCDIDKRRKRTFISCHGTETLIRGGSHINISPNDNIR